MDRHRLTPLQRTKLAFAQQYRCAACDSLLEPLFHIDHIIPLSHGGTNNRANLQALCIDCHIEKTQLEATHKTARICNTCRAIYSIFFDHLCEMNQ